MNKELETRRKVIHLILGAVLVTLIYYGYIDKVILGVITVASFILFYISRKVKIPPLEWCLDKFERADARAVFPGKGPLFYLIGAELSLIFFSQDIALAAITILAIGDSIPNLVGQYFSIIKHPFSDKKYMEGAVAGIILAAIAAHVFVTWYEGIIAAAIAIFVEGIDMSLGDKIDDNLVVPLVAGFVIWVIRLII